MDNSSSTTTLDQVEEDILTYAVSDEALEAAVGEVRWSTTELLPTCTISAPQ